MFLTAYGPAYHHCYYCAEVLTVAGVMSSSVSVQEVLNSDMHNKDTPEPQNERLFNTAAHRDARL